MSGTAKVTASVLTKRTQSASKARGIPTAKKLSVKQTAKQRAQEQDILVRHLQRRMQATKASQNGWFVAAIYIVDGKEEALFCEGKCNGWFHRYHGFIYRGGELPPKLHHFPPINFGFWNVN